MVSTPSFLSAAATKCPPETTLWSRLFRANVSSAVLDVCLSVETLAMYAFPSP